MPEPGGARAPDPASAPAGAPDPVEQHPVVDGRTRLRSVLTVRASRAQLSVALLCALLGFAVVVQVRTTSSAGLASLRQPDLVRILDDLSQRQARLSQETRQLQQTRDELTGGSGSTRSALDEAQQRVQTLGILAGTLPATGPGVQLVVTGPSDAVKAAVLLDTLEELRDAGAEAMQLDAPAVTGGAVRRLRIVASTDLVDVSGGIAVDGVRVAPPYTLLAIGDGPTLQGALNIRGGVLDVLQQGGAEGTVTVLTGVLVDALSPLTTPRYARPAPAPSAG